MSKLIFNPKSAIGIILAAALLRRSPGLEVDEDTTEDDVDLRQAVIDAGIYTEDQLTNSRALSVLDEEYLETHEQGQALFASVVGLHYDVKDFKNQNILRALILNDASALDSLTKEGNIILNFLKSPGYKQAAKATLSILPDEEEPAGDTAATPHDPFPAAPEPTGGKQDLNTDGPVVTSGVPVQSTTNEDGTVNPGIASATPEVTNGNVSLPNNPAQEPQGDEADKIDNQANIDNASGTDAGTSAKKGSTK